MGSWCTDSPSRLDRLRKYLAPHYFLQECQGIHSPRSALIRSGREVHHRTETLKQICAIFFKTKFKRVFETHSYFFIYICTFFLSLSPSRHRVSICVASTHACTALVVGRTWNEICLLFLAHTFLGFVCLRPMSQPSPDERNRQSTDVS